jgi:hypothetical protein
VEERLGLGHVSLNDGLRVTALESIVGPKDGAVAIKDLATDVRASLYDL